MFRQSSVCVHKVLFSTSLALLIIAAGLATLCSRAIAAPGFQVQAYSLGSPGDNDNDLNTTSEALAIYSLINAGTGTGVSTIGGHTYNITNLHNDTETVIN